MLIYQINYIVNLNQTIKMHGWFVVTAMKRCVFQIMISVLLHSPLPNKYHKNGLDKFLLRFFSSKFSQKQIIYMLWKPK